ncbi:hypothetical protein [Fictibacillus barbaricus]|uniref:Uncharacterized protein n=1 Tax=Fictibacillus barbaricus TaxID=182136 RepID=A0ABS2ZEH9_9BACL|nr:hypothetical protein [Fictibacillus barbaricus]MBN3546584.1 hypothetical protein [Fictibacillus barbaricus]GGB42173.1 hypothetical protein GCM10007199_04330 [Fictibacillus barbaricus]
MILYFLEPEVSGGHGEQTIYGTEENVAKEGISGKIKFLHYEFEGWLGDDLLESTPAFIVSSNLENELKKSEFKDYKLEKCLITMSDVFMELYPNKEIPSFTRFIPLGTVEVEGENFKNWSGHHFCLSSKGELVVTKKALDFLKKFSIKHCDITSLTQS